MYVGQSRTNTDANNASSITSTLSTMAADEAVYTAAAGKTTVLDASAKTKGVTKTYTWKDEISNSDISFDDLDTSVTTYAKKVFTNGLPASKTGNGFSLTITLYGDDGTGTPNVSVNCTANTSAPATFTAPKKAATNP